MNEKEEKENKDFCKKLETVALGCHLHVNDEIQRIFKENEIETYQCVEFIFDTPLGKKSNTENVKVFYPFLFRLINSMSFIYKFKREIKYLPSQGNKKVHYFVVTGVKIKEKLKILKDEIRKPSLFKGHSIAETTYEGWKINSSKVLSPQIDKKENFLLSNMKKKITKGDYDSRVISNDFLLAPWFLNDEISIETPFQLLQIPIATKVSFYGYFLIAYSGPKKKIKSINSAIINKIRTIIKDTYVPTLILFHVSNCEDKLNKIIEYDQDDKDDNNYKTKKMINKKEEEIKKVENKEKEAIEKTMEELYFYLIESVSAELKTQLPYDQWLSKNKNLYEFEKAFGKIWNRRYKNITHETKYRKCIKNLKNQLYFHKYNIASPGMLKIINDVISGAQQMTLPKEDGDSLPAALVYGEAGSGKDTIARLVSLFTKDYNSSNIETINMAALKPDTLAIPLLFGINNKKNPTIDIHGLISNHSVENNSVIIFDELNSLDQDLQGSLLRVLENGEVKSLFSQEPDNVKNLIIGIVNEDPEIVSREAELKELKGSEVFLGKVISSYLYENFYRTKKLRPDLMYRLKRGLYIRIPPLCERREDIPILFNANLSRAEKKLNIPEEYSFEVEMDAFELLMREDINWPGNIRQLEAVVKDVAHKAYEVYKDKKSSGDVEIDTVIVKSVLKKHYLIND